MSEGIRQVSVQVLPDGRMDRRNAAKYLGLSVKTLAMHACRRTGPNFVKRGRVFYFREDLDHWLKQSDAPGITARPEKRSKKVKSPRAIARER
jgi:hypothetical protein